MNLKDLQNTPPWDWPRDAGTLIHKTLIDARANPSDRLVAAELAGDFTVINDELADALMAVLSSPGHPEQLRAKAAISFGAALEQADTVEFDDPDDVPISESAFRKIQNSLHTLYLDESNPKQVRRRILEASIRAPGKWHPNAIRAAYSSGDKDWMLTAVFSMRWVGGFDDQILEALKSTDAEIRCEAVKAAGSCELDAAWPHIVALVNDPRTAKGLRIAAINATNIRPREARELLEDLLASEDEEIAEAAAEAIMMADACDFNEEEDEEQEEQDPTKWIH